MKQEQWMSLLGLAYRARKVISGEELVIKEIRSRRAKIVLLSKDASVNTEKKVTDKCHFYNVPICRVENRTMLGEAIGKDSRVVVSVQDNGFAKKLISLLD